jgi:hypothetical protein
VAALAQEAAMTVRSLLAAIALGALPAVAVADPALTGTWSATVDGQPLVVTFDGRGGGRADGRPIRYQVQGNVLLVEDQGQLAMYQFQFRGAHLVVAGGQLPGVVTFSRGGAQPSSQQAAAASPRGGNPGELVGKWCKMSSFNANSGGSQSSACFDLRADGSYTYGAERSSSNPYGGTSSSSGDAGRWSVSGNAITAHSRSGRASTYQLERRNHPKNRDPMLCLDGECYVTYHRRDPW